MQDTLNILIIDDDAGDRKLIIRLLKESGLKCNCTEAYGMKDAVEFCKKIQFHCAIIDYLLPGQNGLEGISILHTQFPDIAIIMLTGEGNEEIATEAMKHGALDYIVKKNMTSALIKKSISTAIEKLLTEKKISAQEIKIEHIAYHDYLTDIPNRFLLEYTLSRALETAKLQKKQLAILIIDLDRFKNINTVLGHEKGDMLLKKITERFQSVLSQKEMLARLGGDEFAVLVENIHEKEEASAVAEKIMSSVEKSFLLDDKELSVSASIGVALFPTDGETYSHLMRNADTAMYHAKYNGRNNFQLYSPDFDKEMVRRFHIEQALHVALEKKELYLHYQPILHHTKKSLIGFSPSVHWKHPQFEKTPALEIISIAEESSLSISINNWILRETFQQYQRWNIKKNSPIMIVINVSPKQLNTPNWFSTLKKWIADYGIDPHHLIFELSETDSMKVMTLAKKTLSSLVEMGVRIFINDIGMTCASIHMLKSVTISGLKINKLYIDNMEDDLKDRNFLKTLLSFAENMELSVVIEGVETKVQLDFLKFFMEGKNEVYYLEKPLPPEAMLTFLADIEKTE